MNEEKFEYKENYTESSSRTTQSKKISMHPGKSILKEEDKKKAIDQGDISKRLIKEVAKKIRRAGAHDLTNRAVEAMRGFSKSPFALRIIL